MDAERSLPVEHADVCGEATAERQRVDSEQRCVGSRQVFEDCDLKNTTCDVKTHWGCPEPRTLVAKRFILLSVFVQVGDV